LKKYAVKARITYRSFTSTSKSKVISENFGANCFEIQSLTGRDIESLATDRAEREVLFAPNAEFEVKDILNDEIKMIEVTSPY